MVAAHPRLHVSVSTRDCFNDCTVMYELQASGNTQEHTADKA